MLEPALNLYISDDDIDGCILSLSAGAEDKISDDVDLTLLMH